MPRSTSSRLVPLSKMPMLSPASPWSSVLLNISTPVQVVLIEPPKPKTSISSPVLITPDSTRPVTTVPRPAIEKVSSIGSKKGFSTSLFGSGRCESTASINFRIASEPSSGLSSLIAHSADPRTMGVESPGYSYKSKSSCTSNSTNSSNSSSSTASHLFRNTTNEGMPTCRASKMCSRVCGMGPSVADTTKIAPSICAAPVIMFLT
mmetsp:Transcript_25117/g.77511  ORF Transcript_25117/g.77511 Transcript_25117/m.77511 type:complete len:206 (-) Transcript_25117:352-969(-)